MLLPRLLPLIALTALTLGLPAGAGSSARVTASPAALLPSSPWSGTITVDYEQDGAGQYSAVGSVKTVMHLTKAGPVNPDGQDQFTQRGSWSSTLDLTFPEDCHQVHIAGTFGGQANVLTWFWKGNNTWYMGMGPSPQPTFQIPFTKTEDTCNLTQYDLTGQMYWLLATTEDSMEWYHHAGACAHTLAGAVNPGIQSIDKKTTVRYQLTQLPDANADGIPDGGNAQTGVCGAKPPPPPPPPKHLCGLTALTGCPPADPYAPGYVDSYSMAGVCGKAHEGPAKGQPRCYILLGQKTIMAVKNHEVQFAKLASLATSRIVESMGEKVLKSQVKSKLISLALKKYAGVAADKANSARGLGKLLAEGLTAAFFAERWHVLGQPGYPAKCFGFETTFNGAKPKPAFDVIWSFVRTWDKNNPPTIGRGITTSNMHWSDQDKGHNYLLPLFCRGPKAQAVATGSEAPEKLLDPPYIKFNVDFNN
jgi:hypothetical protein